MDTTMSNQGTRSNAIPMAIVAALFFILGFTTWVNGSLMPYLQQVLQLSAFEASLILFSFYIAVTFSALPSAALIRRVGYKNGMVLGLCAMMVAGLLFIPAAKTQMFALFLFAQLVMGSGITLLQTAVNPYVVRIGPEESAAVRISIMGILNKGAGVVAPIVFTAMILGGFNDISGELSQAQIADMANSLILPYLGLVIFMALFALALFVLALFALAVKALLLSSHHGHRRSALCTVILNVVYKLIFAPILVIILPATAHVVMKTVTTGSPDGWTMC